LSSRSQKTWQETRFTQETSFEKLQEWWAVVVVEDRTWLKPVVETRMHFQQHSMPYTALSARNV
jgi:hypothetical protein